MREESLELHMGNVSDVMFSPDNEAIYYTAKGYRIPWGMKNSICSAVPESLEPQSEDEPIKLIPYGFANLRMTELPFVR